MAQIVELAAQANWADLAEGEVRMIPILEYANGVRVEDGAVSINVDFA